ncbi:MAG TPA: Na+/H+ antiporter [Gemmatimonadaceae bacterium]|nr:Na+/H+ antiporter [Gemmatimonadaceae bacterium]
MAALELVLLLLAVSAGLRLVAERLRVPYAAILVVGGLILAFIPGLPQVTLPPEVLFLVFIPPLLYAGAITYPLRDFRREIGAILRLSVVLVLISTAAVAVVAHWLHPSFTWAAAITLGAIISPPDPVAVLSIMRPMRIPRAIVSILEGEGLINDATALVVYRLAILAAVTGVFSPSQIAVQFIVGGGGGVAIGLLIGLLVTRVHRVTRTVPVVANTVSLLTPFASYLLADLVGASGILSVVATGMYAARTVPKVLGPAIRQQIFGTWTVVTFMLESLVFILVGLELPYVARALNRFPLSTLLREAALVSLCVVLVRLIWVMPSTYVFRRLGRWFRHDKAPLPPWRSVLFIGWSGLRGADSLVLALSLPLLTASGARFPARDQIIFISFSVIFITLVVQGPTLAPFARWIGIGADEDEGQEDAHARLAAAEAGLKALDRAAIASSPYPEVVRYLKQRHLQRARRWAAREAEPHESEPEDVAQDHDHFTTAPSHEAAAIDDRRAVEYRRVRGAMLSAEQEAILDLRDRGVIADDVMRNIQRDLDLESMLLETSEPVVETPYEASAAIDATASRLSS